MSDEVTIVISENIDILYNKYKQMYDKCNNFSILKKTINAGTLLNSKNKLEKLDLLRRFVNGESFSLRELLMIATDDELMQENNIKNIVYGIRNKLSDVSGREKEISEQTQLNEYIYVSELAVDFEKGNMK